MVPMGQEVNHVSYSMDRILYTDGTNMSGLHILSVSFPVWDESIQRAACFTDAVLSAATVTQSRELLLMIQSAWNDDIVSV